MLLKVHDAIAFDGSSRERTREGFMRANAVIARVGVQSYLPHELGMPGTTPIRLYRPAEEVFAADAVASVEDKPVTDKHPKEDVTPKNWKDLAKGHVRDAVARPQEGLLGARVTISDAALIRDIDSGKGALSCGYDFEYDATPGTTPEGQAYDAIMRRIHVNHVAVVDRARGGPQCRIADGETHMKITIGDHAFDVSEDVAAAVSTLQNELEKARKSASDAATTLTAKIAECSDVTKARDEALARLAPAAIAAHARDLVAARDSAKAFGVTIGDTDDALALRRATLAAIKDPAHVTVRDAFLAGVDIAAVNEDLARRVVTAMTALAPTKRAGDEALSRALLGATSATQEGVAVPFTFGAV